MILKCQEKNTNKYKTHWKSSLFGRIKGKLKDKIEN